MGMVMVMEFHDVVESRRSIRKFTDDFVDDDTIIEGIRMASLAPSAHNRQPWKFKIVSTEEKDLISDALLQKTKDIKGHTGVHTAGIIKEAAKLLVVFIDNQICENRDMDVLSIGAAIENLLLYFTDMGLGAVWIGNTNIVKEEISRILNVSHETISSIAIGVPAQSPKARPRKESYEIIIK